MKWLKTKIEQLKFVKFCYEKSNDSRFIQNVRGISEANNYVCLESYGDETSKQTIYFIDMEESHSGFFAEYNKLLGFLYFADKYGMKPVVRFHSGFCYAEENSVNGSDNPFEYYFKQPSDAKLSDIDNYKLVVRSRKENSHMINELCGNSSGYMRNEQYIDEMSRITNKYIKLNDIVQHEIDTAIHEMLDGEKTLGVHVRGTDFKRNYDGHPVHISTKEYLDESIYLFKKGNYKKIFLATDDENAIDLFQVQFGDKLVFYKDVIRSSEKNTVMYSKVERNNHHYLLGVEVLRDMYTLAACNGLVAGMSQVSLAARIQKRANQDNYDHLSIISRGINSYKGHRCPN